MAAVIRIFIGEANGNAVIRVGPYFLDQAVIEFCRPFSFKERLDRIAAVDELRRISPLAVGRIGECDPGRISAVPGVFGQLGFLRGGTIVERGGEGGSCRYSCRLQSG